MGKLTYNGNRFTKVDKYDSVNDSYRGILLATKMNQKNGQDYKLLDVIDIDFDRVWFNPTNSYITNAEEFFDAIETLDKSGQIKIISDKLDDVISAYISRDEFNAIISQYQGALEYGDHIQVIDNVISAYDVISNSQLYEFSLSYVTTQDFSDYQETVYTKTETEELVDDKIKEIIGEADEQFDTMKEISEWILQQTRYEEVAYSDIILDGSVTYYHINEETGKHESVSSQYITEHPDEQYYVLKPISEDIQNLYDKIGYVTYNSSNGTYTYTGIMQDLHQLQETDRYIFNKLDDLTNNVDAAVRISQVAMSTANTAYDMAYDAYNMADIAYDAANRAISQSDTSYMMAYYAYVEVGVTTYEGYYRPITEEERASFEDGTRLWMYNPSTYSYTQVYYFKDNTTIDYLTYIPRREATGMHKSVEDLTAMTYTSLFNLHVNNDENSLSSYMSLKMTPESYTGDPSRTIYVYSYAPNYSIDEMMIHDDGLITACQMNEILGYVVSWDDISNI